MTSTLTFPFGKYRGLTVEKIAARDPGYLEWALGTDIPQRFPELGAAIRAQLEAVDLSHDEVTLTEVTRPGLIATVRGGGAMHDGTNFLARLVADGKTNCRRAHVDPHWTSLSGSGRSGTYGWDDDKIEEGVYELHFTGGSIVNQSRSAAFYVVRDGKWFRIEQGKRGALAVLRPRVAAA